MASGTPRRVDFKNGIPVGVRSFLVSGKGRVLNLSLTGAYVATPMYLLPQARVRLSIVLKDERRWVEADAVVVWENRGTVGRRDGLPPGYGMRFVDLDKETLRTLQNLLRGDRVEVAAAPPGAPAPPTQPTQEVRLPEPADLVEEPEPEPIPIPTRDPAREMVRESEREGPPFPLRKEVVNRHIRTPTPGVFVLSYDRTQETRVGRADQDLRVTLSTFEGEYAYFYFEEIDEDDERYYRECELYHRLGGDHGQLDNTSHPKPPESAASSECPVCVAAKLR
jgi:hypothetical protein